MGYQKSTYIGPYIEVSGIKETTITKIKRICPYHLDEQTDYKYCPKCGTEIENHEYTETKIISPRELFYSKFHNEFRGLYSPEYMNVFIPSKTPPNYIHIDTKKNEHVDFSQLIDRMNYQMEWLMNQTLYDINFFKEHFGNDNVKICWGVINYWS